MLWLGQRCDPCLLLAPTRVRVGCFLLGVAYNNLMKRKVAIFDIDGTLFRSSLTIELVELLIARGLFPGDAWKKYERERTQWLKRQGSYDSYIEAVVKVFRDHLKGVSYADFAATAEEVIAENKFRLYRYTRDLLKELKVKRYYLLAISHSPKTVVEPFCKPLGFDKTYGTVFEIGPTDKFTGVLLDEHLIFNKGAILKRTVEKEKLTLTESYGVGYTESDISMLEMVEHPLAFNPNKKLYTYAKRMDWPVVVERKDVIYKL